MAVDYGITYSGTSYLTNYGGFAYGPNIIVIHSLECDAVPHIAEQLSAPGGYLNNEGLAPQRMTDPVSIVKCIPDGDQGGHIGGPGNSHCAGVEVSGRAAWSKSQWLDNGPAQQALEHQAQAIAGLAIVYGWSYTDLRYLSQAQIRAGSPRGLCSHNDISMSGISGTNHWDPGTGYPFAWMLSRIQYWFNKMLGHVVNDPPVPPQPPKDWFDMATAKDLTTAVTTVVNSLVPNLVTAAVKEQLSYFLPRALNVLTDGKGNAAFNANTNSTLALDNLGSHGFAAQGAAAAKAEMAVLTNPQGVRYGVVVDDTTGAWYAVAPGTFWHIPDANYVNAGRTAGLLDGDLHHTDAAGIKRIRELALAGAGDIYVKPLPVTVSYTILAGDTLGSIATAHKTTVDAICALNSSITDRNNITVGAVILLPKV